MAQNNNTPVSYWLSVPLSELTEWIDDNNHIIERRREYLKQL
jgi:hypothetical protein